MSKRDQKKHQKEVKRKQQLRDRAARERQIHAEPPREIRNVLAVAEMLMKERDYQQSEDVLLDATRQYPRHVELFEQLLYLYQATKDYRGMENTAPIVAKMRPNDPDSQLMLAQSYLYMQRYGLAMISYREYLDRWPTNTNASKARAALEILDTEIDGPLKALRLTRDELPILAMHDRIVHYIGSSQFAEAAKLAEDLVRLKPDMASVRNNLIMSLCQLARFEEAQQLAKETAQRFPENLFAQSQFGILLFLGGKVDEARHVADATLSTLEQAFDPSSKTIADGVLKLCGLYSFLGDDEQVLRVTEFTEKLINSGRENRGINQHYKAAALLRLDRPEDAMNSWKLCLKEMPTYSQALENLKDLRGKEGHAPWAIPLAMWIPMSLFEEIQSVFRSAGNRASEGIGEVLCKWPHLRSMVPELLDRGDPGAREFAIAVARMDQSNEMMQALLKFATGKRGPDEMRMSALHLLREKGVIDNNPVPFFRHGEWTEIGVRSLDIHWNPTPHPDPKVNDLIAECYQALSGGDVERSLVLSARCVEADPDFPTSLHHRATALKLSGTAAAKREAKDILQELRQRFPDYVFASISLAIDALDERQLEKAKDLLWPLASRTSWHGSEYVAYAIAQVRLCIDLGELNSARSMVDVVKKVARDDSRIPMLELLVAAAEANPILEPTSNLGWRQKRGV